MRPRLGMIFSIPPTLAMLLVAAMIAAGTWAVGRQFIPDRGPLFLAEQNCVLPQVRMADVPFDLAIKDVSERMGINVRLTPAAQNWSTQNTKTVTTRLRNVKAGKVLRTIVESGGGGVFFLDFDERGALIMLLEEVPLPVEEHAFWVGDLLIPSVDQDHLADMIEQVDNLVRTTIAVHMWDRPGVWLWIDPELHVLHVAHAPWVAHEIRALLGKLRTGRVIFLPDLPLQILAGMKR